MEFTDLKELKKLITSSTKDYEFVEKGANGQSLQKEDIYSYR
jgi:hypothetical protein